MIKESDYGILLDKLIPPHTHTHKQISCRSEVKMTANGGAPPRGNAAAAANLRRRRAGGGWAATVTGWKLTPFSVVVVSTGFIAFVAVLHGVGKFLRD